MQHSQRSQSNYFSYFDNTAGLYMFIRLPWPCLLQHNRHYKKNGHQTRDSGVTRNLLCFWISIIRNIINFKKAVEMQFSGVHLVPNSICHPPSSL